MTIDILIDEEQILLEDIDQCHVMRFGDEEEFQELGETEAHCVSCGEIIECGGIIKEETSSESEFAIIFDCPSCQEQLVIGNNNPLELDLAYDEPREGEDLHYAYDNDDDGWDCYGNFRERGP